MASLDISPDEREFLMGISTRSNLRLDFPVEMVKRLVGLGLIQVEQGWATLTPEGRKVIESGAYELLRETANGSAPPRS